MIRPLQFPAKTKTRGHVALTNATIAAVQRTPMCIQSVKTCFVSLVPTHIRLLESQDKHKGFGIAVQGFAAHSHMLQ